jgi:hypothetical protein
MIVLFRYFLQLSMAKYSNCALLGKEQEDSFDCQAGAFSESITLQGFMVTYWMCPMKFLDWQILVT